MGVEYLMSPVIPTPTLTLGFGFLRRSTACILAGVPRQGGEYFFLQGMLGMDCSRQSLCISSIPGGQQVQHDSLLITYILHYFPTASCNRTACIHAGVPPSRGKEHLFQVFHSEF